MTRVDFYVLTQPDIERRWDYACKLTEKAFSLGNSVYLHTDNEQHATALDSMLWSFKPGSFVPHQRIEHNDAGNEAIAAPVMIGCRQAPTESVDILINLSASVPDFFTRFERVIEIVIQTPYVVQQTRDNYRFYRDRGYPLSTHNIR